MIRKGQQVWIRQEVADAGDNSFVRLAVEDEDGGRVLVVVCMGWPVDPMRVELVADLTTVAPEAVACVS